MRISYLKMKIIKETDKKLKSDIKYDNKMLFIHAIFCFFNIVVFLIYSLYFVNKHPSYKIIIFGFMMVLFAVTVLQMRNANLIRKLTLEVRELKNESNENA